MKKTLTKSEKIFIIVTLFIVNIFCIVSFFIGFVELTSVLDGQNLIIRENLSFMQVSIIVSAIIAILILIVSLIILLIKNRNWRGNVIITVIAFILVVVVFYFICKFTSGRCLSNISNNATTESQIVALLQVFTNNYLNSYFYLIVSLIISIITLFISHSLACEIYLDNNKKETEDNNISIEEESIMKEIKSLKAKLRIKDLENEYLNLKAKLDE